MDYKRHCHYSYMKMWQNLDTLTPVYWFRCPKDAKVLDGMSAFRSRFTWQRGEEVTGVGEQMNLPAPYYKGQNTEEYKGLRHCGSDNSIRNGGVHGVDPEIVTTEAGFSSCCERSPVVSGWGIHKAFVDAPWLRFGLAHTVAPHTRFLVLGRETPALALPIVIPGWTLVKHVTFAPGKVSLSIYRREFPDGNPESVLTVDPTGTTSITGFLINMATLPPTIDELEWGDFPFPAHDPATYQIDGITSLMPGVGVFAGWLVPGGWNVQGRSEFVYLEDMTQGTYRHEATAGTPFFPPFPSAPWIRADGAGAPVRWYWFTIRGD